MKLTAFADLDEAVARTQALIDDKQACIDRLDADGGDSSRHREFLESFKRLLAVQEARRQKACNRRSRNRQKQATTWSPRRTAPADRREVA